MNNGEIAFFGRHKVRGMGGNTELTVVTRILPLTQFLQPINCKIPRLRIDSKKIIKRY